MQNKMEKKKIEVQDIIKKYGKEYKENHKMYCQHLRVS